VQRDGTLRALRPIWVVRVGDDLFIRAAYERPAAGIAPLQPAGRPGFGLAESKRM
jgi:hypothetical protein